MTLLAFQKFDCLLLKKIGGVPKGAVVKGYRIPSGFVYLRHDGQVMYTNAILNQDFSTDLATENELKKGNPYKKVGMGWKLK